MEEAVNVKKKKGDSKLLRKRIWKARYIYLMLLPGIIWFLVWCYLPMDGIILAFKQYNARLGILGSPFVGLRNFERIFITPAAIQSIKNTLQISLTRLVVEFPVPILVALLLNEIRHKYGKKFLQTIFTFPHFMSWVIVAVVVQNFFSANGFVNQILNTFGAEPISVLSDKVLFRPLLYLTSNWKEAGWSAIIYLAAITGVDQSLYEAAEIDGASRFQRAWHITLGCIRPTIVIMFIMAVGNTMNAGFDQIFNMQNDVVKDVARIIDTYVYEITFQTAPDYGFSAAVGILKSGVNLILMFLANFVCRKISGTGLIE